MIASILHRLTQYWRYAVLVIVLVAAVGFASYRSAQLIDPTISNLYDQWCEWETKRIVRDRECSIPGGALLESGGMSDRAHFHRVDCGFWIGCTLQREYTIGGPFKHSFQHDLGKVSSRDSLHASNDAREPRVSSPF